MKTLKFDNEKDWRRARYGKLTGSRLEKVEGTYYKSKVRGILDDRGIEYDKSEKKSDLFDKLPTKEKVKLVLSGDKKKKYYEIAAERLALWEKTDNYMDRGKDLEDEAIEEFEEEKDKKVNSELIMWVREDNENIAISPDGVVVGEPKAVEVKCLKSWKFLKYFLKEEIPPKYRSQVVQYFIVNDELQTLYFVMYDPRMPFSMYLFEVERKEIKDEIEYYRELEHGLLAELDELETKLTF